MTPLLTALLLTLQSSAPPVITPAPVLPEDDSKQTYRAHSPPVCGDWRAAREGTAQESVIRLGIYRMWVLGYITGFNIVGPDQTGNLLGDAPHEEFYAAIDGYCTRNPSHTVEDSMYPIAAAFIRRRQGTAASSPPSPGSRRRAQAVATRTCQDWAQDRDNAIMRLAYVSVVRGYVTAYNRWGPDPTGDAVGTNDQALIEERLDVWCRERPSGLLIGVIAPLIDHVAAERAAGRRPPAGMRPRDRFSLPRPGEPSPDS